MFVCNVYNSYFPHQKTHFCGTTEFRCIYQSSTARREIVALLIACRNGQCDKKMSKQKGIWCQELRDCGPCKQTGLYHTIVCI